MASSTVTLLDTIEFSKKLNFNRQSAIGNFLEPAKTCANIVKQVMLSPPFVWRWNRDVIAFTLQADVQDYTHAASWTSYAMAGAWQMGFAYPIGASVIDSNGNTQRVSVAGTSDATEPIWATALDATTTDNTVTWVNLGTFGSTSVVPNFGWIETASLQDPDDNTWKSMDIKISLNKDSNVDRPGFISADQDDGNGTITFRFVPVPNKAYLASLTIQQTPDLFTKLSDTWAPIPDEFQYIYTWGFLALMWLFADDSRWTGANQKFIAGLLGANAGLTATEKSIFLQAWSSITGMNVLDSITQQQGVQARGV